MFVACCGLLGLEHEPSKYIWSISVSLRVVITAGWNDLSRRLRRKWQVLEDSPGLPSGDLTDAWVDRFEGVKIGL